MKLQKLHTKSSRDRRKTRVRSVTRGSVDRPRLSVYRSNKHIYAQIIDDIHGVTLVNFSSLLAKKGKLTKVEKAEKVGQELAELAKKAGVSKVVFDRGSFAYHGRIKSLADGARKSGLSF